MKIRSHFTIAVFALSALFAACSSDDDKTTEKESGGAAGAAGEDAGGSSAGGSSAKSSGGTSNTGGSSATSSGSSSESLEMFSWWTSGGEAEALQALIDVYKAQYPSVRVLNAAATQTGDQARAMLTSRLEANDPPDLFQENATNLGTFLAANPGKLETLDTLFSDNGWNSALIPEALTDIKVDSKIYGIPVGMHRENTLFYNSTLVTEQPESVSALIALCEKIKADHPEITPIATAYQGWIVRIMFDAIAMGSMGGKDYADYYAGKKEANDPEFLKAIDDFDEVLTKCTDPIAAATYGSAGGWTDAAQSVFDGDAAMYFHGDWATAYFRQLGWEPGVDFAAMAAPGAREMFLYGVDVFVIPTGAKNLDGAKNFAKVVLSKEGQIAFNKLKGSTPVRTDVDPQLLNAVGRSTLKDLADATVRMLSPSWTGRDSAILDFAKADRSTDELKQSAKETFIKFFVDSYSTH